MNISDIMTEKNVLIGIKANSKRELLQEIAAQAAKLTGLDERTVLIRCWNVKIWVLRVLAAARLFRTDVLPIWIKFRLFLLSWHLLWILMPLTASRSIWYSPCFLRKAAVPII